MTLYFHVSVFLWTEQETDESFLVMTNSFFKCRKIFDVKVVVIIDHRSDADEIRGFHTFTDPVLGSWLVDHKGVTESKQAKKRKLIGWLIVQFTAGSPAHVSSSFFWFLSNF